MSDSPKNSTEQKQAKDKFVRETISGSKGRTGRVVKSILLTLSLALVFGVCASLAFVLSRPFWEERFVTTEAPSSEPITIFPEETDESTEPSTAETEPPTLPPETTPQAATDNSEEIESLWEAISPSVGSMIASDKADMTDLQSLYEVRRAAAGEAAASLVTVMGRRSSTDYFDNPVSNSSDSCGVIIAVTDKEILILTDQEIVESTGSVFVEIGEFGKQEAAVKAADGIYGIAVVSVPVSAYTEEQLQSVRPVNFGQPYLTLVGYDVMVLGRPMGYGNSVAFGTVTSVNNTVQGTDSQVKIFQTDIPAVENAGGALFNMNGEMVGWVTDRYSSSGVSGLITALALNSMQASIESLSNGEQMCMLGIRGQIITSALAEERGLPEGLYINRCAGGSPAEDAGIQSGDILIALDGRTIATFNELVSELSRHTVGDAVTVSVLRRGPEDFVQMDFDITLAAR